MIFHPDPSSFIEDSGGYGPIGETLVALSNLEFAHDEFVFEMHNRHHDLCLRFAKKFPRHFKKKTDFLVGAVVNVPKLKQIPIFPTGELNLLWLQYQLDELYEIRSILAHGSIFYSRVTPERITWTFDRFVSKQRNTWTREQVKMSNGFLASVCCTADAIRHYIWHLTRCVEDNSSWEECYQGDKEIRGNRDFFAYLASISEEKSLTEDFPPLPPIE